MLEMQLLLQKIKNMSLLKSLALTLEDADLMIKECETNGKAFVVKQNRFNPVIKLKKL